MDWSQQDASHHGTSQHSTSSGQDTRHVLDEINNELALLAQRGDELRKQMTSLHFWNDPIGNRRVRQQERRTHVERRRIVRSDGDRRAAQSDRRLPLEKRCKELETAMATVSQRSRELADARRKLGHQA